MTICKSRASVFLGPHQERPAQGLVLNLPMAAARAFLPTALIILTPAIACAEESARETAEIGVPFSVFLQTVNFVIFFGFLIWLIRHPVKNYFKNRELNFKQAIIRAESAKAAAEERMREISGRLDELARTSESSLAEAKTEASVMMAKIRQDADELSIRLKDDARRTAEFEIERAKKSLREEILSQSVVLAQKLLSDKIVEGDQKRLQTEFVEKIQVVR